MPAVRVSLCALFVCLVASISSAQPAARSWDEKRIALPLIGTGTAYVPHAPTPHVVLMISDDAGWNRVMADHARHLAPQAVVIGISYPALVRHARRETGCWYIASDFEIISHAAQKTLNLPQYHPPVLVGYRHGASVAYAAIAGGPATTFAGLVTIDFCPELRVGREVCAAAEWVPDYLEKRRTNLLPAAKAMPKDWWALQSSDNRACPIETVRQIVTTSARAHLADPGSFDRAMQDLWTEKETKPAAAQPRSATTRELEDELQRLQLPLEFRWPGPGQLTALLIFFSGDGGWASLDEEMSEHLITRGIGIIGVSSLRYFWKAKPPAQVAGDIQRIVAAAARTRRPVFAGGFSFGAEVVPVALREWPSQERRTLAGLIMVAPGPSASFEIDPLDWIRNPGENAATRVAPAVQALAIPALCLAGSDEEDTPCPALGNTPGVRVVRLPGSHHFNSDYTVVADAVAQFIRATLDRQPGPPDRSHQGSALVVRRSRS